MLWCKNIVIVDHLSFNPCFRGTCSWCKFINSWASGAYLGKFQSLFSWNLLLMISAGVTPAPRSVFQSLFSWNLLLMPVQVLWSGNKMAVSILVFVELALDEPDSAGCRRASPGFNPCFRGTCSWWASRMMMACFLESFQSLFSWNLLLMRVVRCRKWHHRPVSILVFVELALDGELRKFAAFAFLEFQSLFSWNLLLMDNIRWKQSATEWVSILVFVELALDEIIAEELDTAWGSFNPCFRGTCSWWEIPQATIARELVSILVFVELALDAELQKKLWGVQDEFQSLFSWNLLLMSQSPRPSEQRPQVSILVFVELALDVAGSSSIVLMNQLFQSLFSWNLLLMSFS